MACDDEVLPLQERIENVADDAELEEVYDTERHLLYVACTRARDRLLVTGVEPASEFLGHPGVSHRRRRGLAGTKVTARVFISETLAELLTMRATVLFGLATIGALSTVESALGQASDDGVVFKEEGQASYYGGQFHGRTTASGQPFDQNAMTAAHPTLPLGAEVTVTDPATGRQVEVEVNDRGPYVGGRDIDLSQGAANKLGITQAGVAKVTIESTKQQVEQAIERPKDVPKVERQLEEARRASAAEGTPQPKPLPSLPPSHQNR